MESGGADSTHESSKSKQRKRCHCKRGKARGEETRHQCARHKSQQAADEVQAVMTTPWLATATGSECKYKEVLYKGSTRAIVGPGFRVRELLFKEECVSVKVSFTVNPAASVPTQQQLILETLVEDLGHAVEHVEMIKASSAVPDANGIARSGFTVSMANKHLVDQFLQKVQTQALDGLANDLKGKAVKNIAQPLAVITSKSISGTFSMTWANGIATGWASAAFPTARAANAFFKSFMASKLKLPKEVKVRLTGYNDGDTNGVKEPWHPPLKKVHLKEGHTKPVFVFDEARICTMDEAAVLQLRFVAMISGLPSEMDEEDLRACWLPHKCTVTILRKPDPVVDPRATARRNRNVHRFCNELELCVKGHEQVLWSKDDKAKILRVRVKFTDADRLRDVATRMATPALWKDVQKPYGQKIRHAVKYKLRALIALDAYRCCADALARAQSYASSMGVVWSVQEPVEGGTHIELVLRGSSLDAVRGVEQALHAAVEGEVFSDPTVQAAFKGKKAWDELVARLFTFALQDGTWCVRGSLQKREIWVYGSVAARRQHISAIKQYCLRHASGADAVGHSRPTAPFVQLDECGHCHNLEDIQSHLIASHTPVRCPTQNCANEIGVKDVEKIADDTEELLRFAVFAFVSDHSDKCAVCPQPGCNQILERPDPETSRTPFVACESCDTVYCLQCSENTDRVIRYHGCRPCADVQDDGPLNVHGHVSLIRERILTLHCPHCHTAFGDVDGSLVIPCTDDGCARHFCGCCLDFSSPDVEATRDHVRQCAKNLTPNSLRISPEQLTAIHRRHRKCKVRDYTSKCIESDEMRRTVVKHLAQDLENLDLAGAKRVSARQVPPGSKPIKSNL